MVYIAPKKMDFPPNDQPTAELFEGDNVIHLNNIDVDIQSGEKYKWRVDCVEDATKKIRTGDVWTFTMNN